jgi:hypothetical protein
LSIENEGAVDANTIVEMTPEQAAQAWNDVAAERKDPLAGAQEPQPGSDPAPAAEPAKVDPPVKDPVLARIEAQDELIKKLHNDLKMATGRVSKIQGELDAGRAAAKAVKDAPTTSQQAAAAADPAKWAAMKEEFPEWAEAISDQISHRIAEAAKNNTPSEPTELVDLDAELRKRETQRVLRKHKDFFDTIKSEEFVNWRKTQPAEINALAASDLAEDAIEMVDLFKAAKAAPAEADALDAKRAARLRQASAPAPRATQPVKASAGGELSSKEIWAQEAAARAKRKAEMA